MRLLLIAATLKPGRRIEKVKLKIVNFKMDGRGSAGKDATENDPTGGKGDNRDEAICGSVPSVSFCSNCPRNLRSCLRRGHLVGAESWLNGVG
ncbi:hypothetical protein [Novipirellula rosea]|uniref:hypothetical protein n=1 Tax=Novipirellula rosea TaxID=1031540 RepID=UPI0031E88443